MTQRRQPAGDGVGKTRAEIVRRGRETDGAEGQYGELPDDRSRGLGIRGVGPVTVVRAHIGHERVALLGNGDDVAMVPGLLAEDLSQGGDVDAQVGFGAHRAGPEQFDQLVLGKNLAAMLDEEQEQSERLGRDGNHSVAAPQHAVDRIDAKWAEFVFEPRGRHSPSAPFLSTGLS